jgi:hypothetical protein
MFRFCVFDKHKQVFIDREIPVASSMQQARRLVGQLLALGMLELPAKAAGYRIVEVPSND